LFIINGDWWCTNSVMYNPCMNWIGTSTRPARFPFPFYLGTAWRALQAYIKIQIRRCAIYIVFGISSTLDIFVFMCKLYREQPSQRRHTPHVTVHRHII
jgi:hypothetical protein